MDFCTTGPDGGSLSSAPCPAAPPAAAANHYAGSGWDEEPVTASGAGDVKSGFADAFGTALPDTRFAPPTLTYDSAPLAAGLELAGIPSLALQVVSSAVLPKGLPAGPVAAFQLDPKLYDVAPDGSAKILTRGAFSEPLDGSPATPAHEVNFDAFGFSNRIPAGHRLRVTLSSSDVPYLRPTNNPFAVALLAGSSIDLPAVTG
jgi:ABC-2 type transport system ATP-binding protein